MTDMFTAICYDCEWVGTRMTDLFTATSQMNQHLYMGSCDSSTVVNEFRI